MTLCGAPHVNWRVVVIESLPIHHLRSKSNHGKEDQLLFSWCQPWNATASSLCRDHTRDRHRQLNKCRLSLRDPLMIFALALRRRLNVLTSASFTQSVHLHAQSAALPAYPSELPWAMAIFMNPIDDHRDVSAPSPLAMADCCGVLITSANHMELP